VAESRIYGNVDVVEHLGCDIVELFNVCGINFNRLG
jgi:hypothetical protein